MNIGEPLRTIIVEPLELPVNEPNAEPDPESLEPEPEQVHFDSLTDLTR